MRQTPLSPAPAAHLTNGVIRRFGSISPYMACLFIISLVLCILSGCSLGDEDGTNNPGVILTAIAVTPANPSIAIGASQQLAATGSYSDGTTNDMTTSVIWNSSNTAVATIDSVGMASAVAAGTITITATSGDITGTITLTVTNATLLSIAITPASPIIAIGASQQLTATGSYSDSATNDITTSVTWSLSDTAVASIDNGGLAFGLAVGSATLTAAAGDVSGSTILTVTNATLLLIAVSPADPRSAQGSSRQFTAAGTYSDGSTQDIIFTVTWTSSDTAVATIDVAGLSTCFSPGTTTITATAGTVSGNVTLTVWDILDESPFGFHPALISNPGYTNRGYGDATTLGVVWTRPSLYALWSIVQPDRNSTVYDFSQYDQMYGNVPTGMMILGNIASEPSSTELGYCLPGSYAPVDEVKYGDFVKATVEWYDGDGDMPGLVNPIKYWQVGNEPNVQTKDGFADLQRITYIAIKDACPDCMVLIGGVPGMPPVSIYITNFDTRFKPILDTLGALGGQYVDIMDFHWYGNATGDYKGAKEVYDYIRSVMNAAGFPDIPIWITEMGSYSGKPFAWAAQTERQQALDMLKRFVYPLSFGVKKVFPAFGLIEGFGFNEGYFDFTGLIYDDYAGGPGLGVKKLGYYTYRKMTELLEGSDWNAIEVIRESGDVYVYKFIRNDAPIYVAWWDYFNV